jgi:predicted phage tail protein
MTEVILHGILAKEFGSNFMLKIARPKDCIKALDANLNNFVNRINELASQGFHYTIIVDGVKMQDIKELEILKNFKEINLVPLIVGSGAVVGGLILTGIASLGGAASAGAMVGFLATGFGSMVATLVGGLVLTAITLGLQMLMQDKNKGPEAVKSTTTAIKESYDFSNKANVANQGSVIPIGYGRLKVGSQVIQFTVKAFQSQISFDDIAKRFNEGNTLSVSTKMESTQPTVIGSISGKVSRLTPPNGGTTYAISWDTSNVTKLTLDGKSVQLKKSDDAVLELLLQDRKTSPNWTFVLTYPGGTKTVKVTSEGKFSG